MNCKRIGFGIFMIALCVVSCRVKLEPVRILTFKEKLQEIFPESEITMLESDTYFQKSFKIVLNQPFDAKDKSLGYFKQEIILQHIDEENPMILISSGKEIDRGIDEVGKLIKANQVSIVNRFAIDSVPNEFKTVQLASKDYHEVIQGLKKIYENKWVSVGEKTEALYALNHRTTYPWDVEVTIVKNSKLMNLVSDVEDFVENQGKKIVYLNTGSALNIEPHVDAIRIQTSNKSTSIKDLSESDYNRFIDKLKMWLGYQVFISN